MDGGTARRALQLAGGKTISAVMLEREGTLSMHEALAQSFDEADLSLGPPSIWSKVDVPVLLESLLSWVEKRGRERNYSLNRAYVAARLRELADMVESTEEEL